MTTTAATASRARAVAPAAAPGAGGGRSSSSASTTRVGGVAVVAVVGPLAVGGAVGRAADGGRRHGVDTARRPTTRSARTARGPTPPRTRMSTKTPTPPHDPYGGAADDDHQADYDLDGLASFIDAGDDGVLDSFVSGVLQEFDDHAAACDAASAAAAAAVARVPRRLRRRRRRRRRPRRRRGRPPPPPTRRTTPRPPGVVALRRRRRRRRRLGGPLLVPARGPPISPPLSPPSPPGYNPLAVADCRGRARVISLGGVPFVCVFDERWSGAALTRQQLERMLAASQPATLAAARKAECAPEESYAIDPLTLTFKDRAVRARCTTRSRTTPATRGTARRSTSSSSSSSRCRGRRRSSASASTSGRGPTTTSRCGRSPSTSRWWAGCAAGPTCRPPTRASTTRRT